MDEGILVAVAVGISGSVSGVDSKVGVNATETAEFFNGDFAISWSSESEPEVTIFTNNLAVVAGIAGDFNEEVRGVTSSPEAI